MKILVSTFETQDVAKGDFCFCREGEIVVPDLVSEDGFMGIETRKGTTTMKIVEHYLPNVEEGKPITFEELLDLVMQSEVDANFCADIHEPDMRLRRIDDLEKMLDRVAEFPVGTILAVEKGQLVPRQLPPEASE